MMDPRHTTTFALSEARRLKAKAEKRRRKAILLMNRTKRLASTSYEAVALSYERLGRIKALDKRA